MYNLAIKQVLATNCIHAYYFWLDVTIILTPLQKINNSNLLLFHKYLPSFFAAREENLNGVTWVWTHW